VDLASSESETEIKQAKRTVKPLKPMPKTTNGNSKKNAESKDVSKAKKELKAPPNRKRSASPVVAVDNARKRRKSNERKSVRNGQRPDQGRMPGEEIMEVREHKLGGHCS